MSEKEEKKSFVIEGRNAVLEAFRAGERIEKLYMLKKSQDKTARALLKEAEKRGTPVQFAEKEQLFQLAGTGRHQGFVACVKPYEYAKVEDMLFAAEKKGEPPFLILLDGIEDPHNLGAVIRTANLSGAHGVIIPKRRAAGLTPSAERTSAGAANYTLVARVTNLVRTIESLKKRGLWFVCADMAGESMYALDFKGPIGLIIGSEGEGVSRLVKEACDFIASIPMKGEIGSLNASVAAGVLAYEIVRQRLS